MCRGIVLPDAIAWRIVEKRVFFGLGFKQISEDLLVPQATCWDVYDTWQGFRLALPANKKLNRHDELLLLDLILEADADT